MINPNFVIIGVLISFMGGLSYVISTLKGRTKPNRVTWFIWASVPFIAFSAEINKGVGIQSLLTFIVGFNPFLIFLASFINKNAQWKLGRLDFVCGGLAIIGIILWLIFRDGNFAIFFAILADGLAGVPTIIKAYRFPETENYIIFLGSGISAAITLLTITVWNFAHYGFPLYIFLICFMLFFIIRFKVGERINFRSLRT